MTKGAAQELGPHGIRVNAVLPGTIESRMIESIEPTRWLCKATPLRAHRGADRVARCHAVAGIRRSDYATGADYLVDGGMKA